MSEEEEKPIWLLRPINELPYAYVSSWEDVREFIEDGERDEVWCIKREWLTQMAIDALPEFDGW